MTYSTVLPMLRLNTGSVLGQIIIWANLLEAVPEPHNFQSPCCPLIPSLRQPQTTATRLNKLVAVPT